MSFLNSLTEKLLKVVGSPFVDSNSELTTNDATRLYYYATKNRMPLLYLGLLDRVGRLDSLVEEYNKLSDRYVKTIEAISRICRILEIAGVNYTFFKSIRPYQEVTVDIDILIFGAEYQEVIRTMINSDYMFLGSGPLSLTFRDIEAEINLDIYNEVGVSRIIYLDKNKLRSFISNVKLPNGEIVPSLHPSADLLTVITHSVIKEHIYVLSEYYTTLYYLYGMNDGDLNSFFSLVHECRAHSSVKTHLGITAMLHLWAYSFLPPSLKGVLNDLGSKNLEVSRVKKMGFQFPHKYHPLTITETFIEKFREDKARRSFGSQALCMLNRHFASSVFKEALHYVARETY